MNHNRFKDEEDENSRSELIPNVNATKNNNTMTPEQQAKRKKIIKWSIIGAIITIIVVLAIVLPIVLIKKDDNPDNPPIPPGYNPYKVDPKTVTSTQAGVKGVIQAGADSYSPALHQASLLRLLNKNSDNDVAKLGVETKQIPRGVNNPLVQNISFSFDMYDYRTARLLLTDNDKPRFEIPDQAVPNRNPDMNMRLEMLGFSYNLEPFSFQFTDVVDGSTFVTTKDMALVMLDKFIQVDFLLPSQRIFGFGERVHDMQLGEGTWTMWATGQDQMKDDGQGRKGTYGVHPFILVQGSKKDDFFGMYFKNSNAQSPVLKYTNDGRAILSYITIGGNMEVYFFIHGSAKNIIQSYQNMIGGSINLPPFWALGWHQASQKYTSQDVVTDVITQYNKAGIPLEAVYLDYSYLKSGSNFQVDTTAFPDLIGLGKSLHDNNQRLVVILDSVISAEDTKDAFYTQGDANKVFIKTAIHNNTDYNGNLITYRSGTKDSKVVLVDWFNDKCVDVFKAGINQISQIVPFDGIWLNQNEPTTATPGEVSMDPPPTPPTPPTTETAQRFLLKDDNYGWYHSFPQDADHQGTFFLPFVPQYFGEPNEFGNFDMNTASLNATHSSNQATEYNVHNLYGHMQAKRVYDILSDPKYPISKNRAFILTRSTFASSGRYASHWLGDTPRDWDFMKYTIAGIQSMNMFGIPHVGADVCGYKGGKRDDEMCARWIQLSTFYPLARANQNDQFNGQPDDRQEPYQLQGKYKQWAIASIQDRYQYLRHMYTCLWEVSAYSGSCIDPLFYYYPNDDNVYNDISGSFMVGGALLVTPVLQGNDPQNFTTYLPQGQWVNLGSVNRDVNGANDKGSNVVLDAQGGTVNVHLRPGSLIPWQDYKITQAKTTQDLINKPISLVANRDVNGVAQGTLFLDTGLLKDENYGGKFEYYQINVQANSIQMFFAEGNRGTQDHTLDQVLLVNGEDLKDVKYACYLDHQLGIHAMDVAYLDTIKALRISPKQGETLKYNSFQAIHFAKDNELNMCDPLSYQYNIKGGQLPNLTLSSATMELEHAAGTLPNIQVTLQVVPNNIANIKWTWKLDDKGNPPAGKRVPVDVPMDLINIDQTVKQDIPLKQFFSVTDKPFQVNVKYRTQNNPSNVFSVQGMIYDQYLNWVAAQVYTNSGDQFQGIFGLGERADKNFFFQDGVYSLMSRDAGTPDEDGQSPGKNMYGVHPFFSFRHKENAWVGVLYKLGQSQDWYIKNNKDTGVIGLNTIAHGGIVDIYVMQGTTPDQVAAAYQTLIGKPVLIPQWSLGWHQCRWGYRTIEDVEQVVAGYEANGIPLDVQWTDIDYLRTYRDFSYDWENYWRLPEFVDELHAKNMKYIPIMDAGIAYRPKGNNYTAFESGQELDLFIKAPNKEIFIGQVWPNDAAYPDYFNPATSAWWAGNLDKIWESVKFDGLWEDMNEASNFCNGVCYDRQKADSPVKFNLKYTPTGRNLEFKGMSMDAFHSNGFMQLDTHNYYGSQMVKATHDWFQGKGSRTFIIERSSFAGMGKYGSRWLGDNWSDYKFMAYSVSGTMLMNIFGIPMTGSDICGFNGNTNPELCARWHMVGAFYPFSRNHNGIGNDPQEPYVYKDKIYEGSISYMDIMKYAIKTKYEMIRYYYSSLLMLSYQGTGTFYKPLFFEFPEDMKAYQNVTTNIMLGSELKLGINSDEEGRNTTWVYFPAGLWCNLYKSGQYPCFTSTGQAYELPSKAYDFHLHIRQGAIIPHQNLNQAQVDFSTSADLQALPIDLHILGEPSGVSQTNFRAQGVYMNDDGVTLNAINKTNGYSIVATNVEAGLSVQIFWIQKATDFINPDTGCGAVNQNDYVQNLYFYNGKGFSINKSFTATATLASGLTSPLGTATYDADSDRLVLKIQKPICLSTITRIDFAKSS